VKAQGELVECGKRMRTQSWISTVFSPPLCFCIVVCNEGGAGFPKGKASFHMIPHHHVTRRKGEAGVSNLSQQSLHNYVMHCCELTFIALAPGVKSRHAHGDLTKEKIEVLSTALSKG